MTTIFDTTSIIQELGIVPFCEKYQVLAKYHPEFPNLVLLKYNQITANMADIHVRHCRGLILDTANNYKPICFTYRKFANEGESYADPLDWASGNVKVYEKEDGSLMQLCFYAGQWRVASSGTPDAGGNINGAGKFSELFWKTWNDLGYKLPTEFFSNLCFAFELCTKYNRILVEHSKPKIVLHGVRDLDTMWEENPEFHAKYFGWECIKTYPLSSLESIITAAAKLQPNSNEGFVACEPTHATDGSFQRQKVKSPAYVALSHMSEGMGPRRLLEIVRSGETGEFLAYFPQWVDDFNTTKNKYDALVTDMEIIYQGISHIQNQKEFAGHAVKYLWSGALFQKRKGTDFKQFLKDITITTLEVWLGMKTIPENK